MILNVLFDPAKLQFLVIAFLWKGGKKNANRANQMTSCQSFAVSLFSTVS